MDNNNSKINLGDFSMEKIFTDAGINVGQIKMNSPASKISMDDDNNLLSLVGYQLICMDDKDIKYDLSDINNDTVISIDKHHEIECLMILKGSITATWNYVFKEYSNKKLNIKTVINMIVHEIGYGILYYENLKMIGEAVVDGLFYTSEGGDEIKEKLKSIITNIWFLPYSEIDIIKNNIKNELTKFNKNNGDNNECNDKPSE